MVPSTSRRRSLWRASASVHAQPWWFSARDVSANPGRFDLSSPAGTCYWALSAAGAIIETAADPDALDEPVLSLAALANLTVWEAPDVPAARRQRLADLTVAALPHLTGEIGTVVPYDIPWAWADAFLADARTGICYRGRFSHVDSVALFGSDGLSPNAPIAVPHPATALYDDLPKGFKADVGSVGAFRTLPRGPPPR